MNPRVEKLLRLSPVIKAAILFLIVVLIGAGFFFLVYAPEQERLANLYADAQGIEARLRNERKIAADLPRFKAEYEKLNAKLNKALTELPNEKEIPGLLTSISTLAKNQGLDILSFTPRGENVKDFYAEVPVAMNLSGTFHDVAFFFDSVGQLPRIINIGEVLLERPTFVDGRTQLSISCIATTYRFVDRPAGGK